MDSKEKKLSDYIDSLNEEKRPKEHGSETESSEMEGLFETVRLVRSLKGPSLPRGKYAETLVNNINLQISKEKALRNSRKRWFYGLASAVASVAIIFALNTIGSFSKNNMVSGDDTASGRVAAVMEVTPQGGSTYKLWIDKETKMPLQKQSAMEFSLQYKVRYTDIVLSEAVPKKFFSYLVPKGYKEINTNPEQFANSLEEAKRIVGFTPRLIKNIPASMAALGRINNNTVEVPVDLEEEKGDQKNVDAGHTPWKLDPAFVAQVFVSLKISPEGIQGDYPIDYDEFKVVQNTGKEAVVYVGGSMTPIKRVYLKRLIRQDNTGVWTVVGYDPA